MTPAIGQVLFDFDQVLAGYDRRLRLAHLAAHAGCDSARVQAVLFDSGLETAYDAGALDTRTYLALLGDGLGAAVHEEDWVAARLAATHAHADALRLALAIAPARPLGILTNNGVLMAQVIAQVLGSAHARFDGRVLCSGMLGRRKPDPAVFTDALARLDWNASSTLFVDDLFANVQGARRAGLHADSVRDARALGRVLKRFGLA